jgi:sialic acid synthase SpsE
MRPIVIAEAGVNHNGEIAKALELVRAAKAAGADIVKFQHFTADKIVAAAAPPAAYQVANTGQSSQSDMLRELELDLGAFATVAHACREQEIGFLCTAFDMDAVEELVGLGMAFVKIPSGEITNAPMLDRYGRLGLPVLLSTGMSTMAEVEEAVGVLDAAGTREITLLQCTSLYPAPADTLNLRAMQRMAAHLKRPVGLSDHSLDDYAAVAATALGANVIEKHLTLDRTLPGPDHAASLEPMDFMRMVKRIHATASALGDGIKQPAKGETETAQLVRRSWHAVRDLRPGAPIAASDVVLKRPADGLSPSQSPVGRLLKNAVAADRPIHVGDLERP